MCVGIDNMWVIMMVWTLANYYPLSDLKGSINGKTERIIRRNP